MFQVVGTNKIVPISAVTQEDLGKTTDQLEEQISNLANNMIGIPLFLLLLIVLGVRFWGVPIGKEKSKKFLEKLFHQIMRALIINYTGGSHSNFNPLLSAAL